MYEDYMIPINDVRFEDTLSNWLGNALIATQQMSGSCLITPFDFAISRHVGKPAERVRSDIKFSLPLFKKNVVSNVILGYDPKYCSFHQLAYIVEQINSKRRRLDYSLMVTTSYSFTNSINSEFLDYPIPKLNLLLICYSGPKEIHLQ